MMRLTAAQAKGREKELQQPYYTTVFEKKSFKPFQNMNINYFYDFRYSI